MLADAFDIPAVIGEVVVLTTAIGVVVTARTNETDPRHDRTPASDDIDLES